LLRDQAKLVIEPRGSHGGRCERCACHQHERNGTQELGAGVREVLPRESPAIVRSGGRRNRQTQQKHADRKNR
jgi:hypothetical protein